MNILLVVPAEDLWRAGIGLKVLKLPRGSRLSIFGQGLSNLLKLHVPNNLSKFPINSGFPGCLSDRPTAVWILSSVRLLGLGPLPGAVAERPTPILDPAASNVMSRPLVRLRKPRLPLRVRQVLSYAI